MQCVIEFNVHVQSVDIRYHFQFLHFEIDENLLTRCRADI